MQKNKKIALPFRLVGNALQCTIIYFTITYKKIGEQKGFHISVFVLSCNISSFVTVCSPPLYLCFVIFILAHLTK